jgi:hypothetical protein
VAAPRHRARDVERKRKARHFVEHRAELAAVDDKNSQASSKRAIDQRGASSIIALKPSA